MVGQIWKPIDTAASLIACWTLFTRNHPISIEAQRIPRWAEFQSAVAFWRSSALRGRPYRVATAVAECRACMPKNRNELVGLLDWNVMALNRRAFRIAH